MIIQSVPFQERIFFYFQNNAACLDGTEYY